MTYCLPPHSELDPTFDTLSLVARWFRKLKENAQPLELIDEITYLINKLPLISNSQIDIVNYNVCNLYLKAGLPVVALKKLN